MHYFIDGYNLLFRLVRADGDLQTQRDKIIQELSTKIQLIGLDATLVFDAQYQLGESTKTHLQDLTILFTGSGETADDCIIDELRRVLNPREETVVTSDKKLAWRARRKMAHSETVEAFMEWLNRRYKNKIHLLKEKKKPLLLIRTASAAPSIQKEAGSPSNKILPEDCLEYYASVFEKIDQEHQLAEVSLKKIKLTQSKKKKSLKNRKVQEKDSRTDQERWLNIFEERSNSPLID